MGSETILEVQPTHHGSPIMNLMLELVDADLFDFDFLDGYLDALLEILMPVVAYLAESLMPMFELGNSNLDGCKLCGEARRTMYWFGVRLNFLWSTDLRWSCSFGWAY